MRAYRFSVNLKLGLVVFAVAIAVASLVYTRALVERLRDREAYMIELWAGAIEEVAEAQQRTLDPRFAQLSALADSISSLPPDTAWPKAYREALAWVVDVAAPGEVGFISEQILRSDRFAIPAIISDSLSGDFTSWRNVGVAEGARGLSDEERALLVTQQQRFDALHTPVPVRIVLPGDPGLTLVQYIHYGESALVLALRWFPYIQLAFVALFVLVGYLSFSYIRRSEQSNLWVGMAREAAHQLGTPISSLMGWRDVLEDTPLDDWQSEAVGEIGRDIERLQRVTARFSDIGSLPRLERLPLRPVVDTVVHYMERRLPQVAHPISLSAEVPDELEARLNADLFEWVIENLVKNSIDAMRGQAGEIRVEARAVGKLVQIDVSDTGRGIDRKHIPHVFRPGYSSKKRGWGLGLSLARRIVEEYHGGRIRLLSTRTVAPSGTTFRIELPLA